MKLAVICGFLGSGKTTLLLKIAERCSKQGLKVAVLENEVGKIGIDDEVIRKNGLNVKSIFSGCICCSLRGDLISTLLVIEREFSPDIVFLEPSGVAGPKQVLSAFCGYGGEIDSTTVINIIDASRFSAVKDFSIPLIKDGISIADLLLINKIDLIDKEQLDYIYDKIAPYRTEKSECREISLCSDNDLIIDEIAGMITEKTESPKQIENQSEESAEPIPEPAVFAKRKTLQSEKFSDTASLIDKVKLNLLKISRLLYSRNAFQGHIKVFLNGGKCGAVTISSTSSEQEPQVKGAFVKAPHKIFFTVNAIIYDIDDEDLENIINSELMAQLDSI
jgi:G3E family GTPase